MRGSQEVAPDFNRMEPSAKNYFAPINMEMRLADYDNKNLKELMDEMMQPLETVNTSHAIWELEHPYRVLINVYTNKATKESQDGFVLFMYYELFDNIPLLYHISYYLKYDLPRNKNRITPSDLMLGVGAYGEMQICYQPHKSKTLVEDVPLAGFEKVQNTLRKEIEEGHIRRILEMRLGNAMVDLNGDQEGYLGASRPIWHIEAWWCNNGKTELRQDDPNYPTDGHGKMECVRIAIDAQTGKILGIGGDAAPKQAKIKGIGEYQDVIHWEDIEK